MNAADNGADNGARIGIVLVDDAVELRSMLRMLLERNPRIAVIGEAGDVPSAEAVIADRCPDVVVVDLAMPGGGALEMISRLRANHPTVALLVLSGYPAATTAERCLIAGADVYLEKGTPVAELTATVLRVAEERP